MDEFIFYLNMHMKGRLIQGLSQVKVRSSSLPISPLNIKYW